MLHRKPTILSVSKDLTLFPHSVKDIINSTSLVSSGLAWFTFKLRKALSVTLAKHRTAPTAIGTLRTLLVYSASKKCRVSSRALIVPPSLVGVPSWLLLDDLSVLLPAVASVAAFTASPFPALEAGSMTPSAAAAATLALALPAVA